MNKDLGLRDKCRFVHLVLLEQEQFASKRCAWISRLLQHQRAAFTQPFWIRFQSGQGLVLPCETTRNPKRYETQACFLNK